MADATYQPGVYREQGGNRFVVASSGSADVESGGEIDIEAGGKLEISGTAFITTGAKVDLSTGRAWILSDIYTTGTLKINGGISSTGGITGSSGTFTAGIAASSGVAGSSGTFTAGVAVTSGVSGSSGTFTGALAVTSGISGSSGTFSNAVNAGGGLVTTGTLTADQITTTGGTNKAISGGQIYAQTGYIHFVEQLTSGSAQALGYGVSLVYLATAYTLPLAAPVAGMEKWINCISTGASLTVTATAAGADITTAGSTTITMTTGTPQAPTWIHLLGLNSTRYVVLGQSANVTVA